jgi:hypothetical protein
MLGSVVVAWRARRAALAAERLQHEAARREREIRCLHDSLLQDLQGLMFQFQAMTEDLRHGSPERSAFDHMLRRCDGWLEESRRRFTRL